MSKLTPMLEQYYEIKEKHPTELLFFRLGDFYELFGDDAKKASKILDIVLTARNKGSENEMPMCGVPHHALENYMAKLLRAGQRVAICDQVSDPTLPGIVKREVVQVVTPGTTLVDSTLNNKNNNFIVSLSWQKNKWGMAIADLTTGEFQMTEIADLNLLKNELFRFTVSEVIINGSLQNDNRHQDFISQLNNVNVYQLPNFEKADKVLLRHFAVKNLQSFGVESLAVGIEAAGTLLHYLKETQKTDLSHINKLRRYNFADYMVLDEATIRNLELFYTNYTGDYQGSLLSVIDRTMTSMGARLLRRWLILPLLKDEKINQRLQAVAELKGQSSLQRELADTFKQVADIERLIGKIGCRRTNARDLMALKSSLDLVPGVKKILQPCKADLLVKWKKELAEHTELRDMLNEVFVPEPGVSITEGGMVRDGYNEKLDELRTISKGGKDWLAKFQAQEIERTGISSMKVKFNRVFGYYIEVSKANMSQVPDDYIRKQTLVNAERYITPELKEYEEKILGAEEKINNLEHQIFQEILEKVIKFFPEIQKTASIVAGLDAISGFARLAVENNYCQPKVVAPGELKVVNGRHPVIESFQKESYVPNDCNLNHSDNEFVLLTGPNMSGKSSFLRQTALISLLAQIGSFVPAEKAELGVVDRIFTRVGASDNLAQGVSTFMAEMQEAANILNNATKNSLIILDELGRGTSTYDGVSIAWAIMEHIHDKIGAKTIFATHYHELTGVVEKLKRAENYCVAVSENEGKVIFLHKIIKGATSDSYGIEVAKIAGLAKDLTSRAEEILDNLEKKSDIKIKPKAEQASLLLPMSPREEKVSKALAEINPDEMTPIEALQKLSELRKEVDGN